MCVDSRARICIRIIKSLLKAVLNESVSRFFRLFSFSRFPKSGDCDSELKIRPTALELLQDVVLIRWVHVECNSP